MTPNLIKLRGISFDEAKRKVQNITDQYRIIGHTVNTDLEEFIQKNIVPKYNVNYLIYWQLIWPFKERNVKVISSR